jgi:hypothetical protein
MKMDDKSYSLMGFDEKGHAVLGIIQRLIIKPENNYKIKPSKARDGATFCQVVSVAADHALCIVGKRQGRGYYARTKWFDPEYKVPFSAFLEWDW